MVAKHHLVLFVLLLMMVCGSKYFVEAQVGVARFMVTAPEGRNLKSKHNRNDWNDLFSFHQVLLVSM